MKSILIFGLGFLQKSLIQQCKNLGLRTVGIDPIEDPICKDDVDIFEIVDGNDYERTIAIAKQYDISGVICTATDKPLVMMARIAETFHLPFYSVETAKWSTDKLLMKQRFLDGGIPCAKGELISSFKEFSDEKWSFPVIVKPRDNSGSRGVIYCKDEREVANAMQEAMQFTKKDNVLIEEFIEGPEYSIESLHYHGKTHVIQYTQKQTTKFPYNVELGHIQPADITDFQKKQISEIIAKIAEVLNFNNCGSHTELKINANGKITVIETSPRLGGDFITSTLVPLSTGINMERLLAKMSVGETIDEDDFNPSVNMTSGVIFFELPEGRIQSIDDIESLASITGCMTYKFEKKVGDELNPITSSLNRYGYAIFQTNNGQQIRKSIENAKTTIKKLVKVL